MFTKPNKTLALLLFFLLSAQFFCLAQTGDFLGPLSGRNHKQKNHGYQGMDLWGKYVFSCQKQGIATVYLLSDDGFSQVSQFSLGSFNPLNHANVASFGVEKVCRKDPFPVVYVSHCHKKPINDCKDLCFVERIALDMQSSELVQTIFYDDRNGDFGYALQWVVDRKGGFLYGYGNTVNNSAPQNRHRIIKFRLPKLSEGEFVRLRPEDAIENYTIEEVSDFRFNPIGQGLDIKDGKLYMPTGFGSPKHPSVLYVWDLKKKTMEAVDLSEVTSGELEDVAVMKKGKLLLQSQDGLFVVRLGKRGQPVR